MKATVMEIDHHRNGVGGQPFTVAIIEDEDDNGDLRTFLAIDFSWEDADGELQDAYHVAVLDLEQMCEHSNVYSHAKYDGNGDEVKGTGGNGWRGDMMVGTWRKAMAKALRRRSDNFDQHMVKTGAMKEVDR